jgi:hypothetical protein
MGVKLRGAIVLFGGGVGARTGAEKSRRSKVGFCGTMFDEVDGGRGMFDEAEAKGVGLETEKVGEFEVRGGDVIFGIDVGGLL